MSFAGWDANSLLWQSFSNHPFIMVTAVLIGFSLFMKAISPAPPPPSWDSKILPHGVLTRVYGRLWSVDGTLKRSSMGRRMLVFQLEESEGGGTIIVSGIAVNQDTLDMVLKLGEPRILVIPNSFHREDAAVWAGRFPDMKIACPRGARKATLQAVGRVDMDAMELGTMFESCRTYPIPGWNKDESNPFELVLEFRASPEQWVMTVTDSLFNNPPIEDSMIGKFFGWLMQVVSPDGYPVVSRIGRFMAHDMPTVAAFFQEASQRSGLAAFVVGHGDILRGPAVHEGLKRVARSCMNAPRT